MRRRARQPLDLAARHGQQARPRVEFGGNRIGGLANVEPILLHRLVAGRTAAEAGAETAPSETAIAQANSDFFMMAPLSAARRKRHAYRSVAMGDRKVQWPMVKVGGNPRTGTRRLGWRAATGKQKWWTCEKKPRTGTRRLGWWAATGKQKWWAPEELNLATPPSCFIVHGVTVRWRERSPSGAGERNNLEPEPARWVGGRHGPTEMVPVRGTSSNRNHRAQGWRGGCAQAKMVPVRGTSSNRNHRAQGWRGGCAQATTNGGAKPTVRNREIS